MNRTSLAIGALIALLTAPAFAQTATVPATVNFTGVADMPTLQDANKLDSFSTEIKDAQVDTTYILTCSAGHSAWLGLAHADKVCGFQKGSNGQIFNPKKNTWQPRTQYTGSYTVDGDGTTIAKDMSISYLPQGNQSQFAGSLNLKPELTSSGAAGLKDLVLKKLQTTSAVPVDNRVDTIDFNNFYIPSAGLPSDKGCTWQGNAVFPYQNYAWYMKLSAICDNQRYDFTGNMPFLGDSSTEGTTTYNVTLTLAGSGAASDDSLFADGTDDSVFNDVTGITGTISMVNSNIVTVTLDGEPLETPEHVEISGAITGTGVPLPVVRSFAAIVALLPSTFFGA